ncbi:MAG: hypothetical protein GX154_07530 [Clostridiales bacterium]|nr:hypothetical protein [Clostridiales bacterium]
MNVLIKDIMDLSIFQEAKVVGGHNGLNKEVSSVTVAEVPDAADWLKGGELVVTTGYFIKDNDDSQKKWMTDLIKGGATALAIKPDRFLGKTPDRMIDVANENSFCLIELPFNITWPVIMESVMNAINDNQNQIIKRTEEIHNKLTEIVLRGHGLPFIAKVLTQLVGNIIIVEDPALNSLAVSCPNDHSNDKVDGFLSYRLSQEYKDRFKTTEYYTNALKSADKKTLILDVNDFNSAYKDLTQITIPIVADRVVYGFITLVEFFKKANQIDIIALEHGATTIALEMMKEKIAFETEKRLKRDFLDDLLQGKIGNGEAGGSKYKFNGFDITGPAVAILIDVYGIDTTMNNKHVFYRASNNKVLDIIENQIKENDPNAFINDEHNRYAILYHFPINKEKATATTDIKKLCDKIGSKILEEFPKAQYCFGVGNVYYQLPNLRKSYKEAKKALEVGQTFMGSNQTFLYSELGIYRLLFMMDRKEIVDYCRDSIGNLMEYDKNNNEDLCGFLEVFLLNNGNVAQTSKDLYIHPNTLSYRLKKIAGILGKDINDSKIRFNLYFALMIKKLFIDK